MIKKIPASSCAVTYTDSATTVTIEVRNLVEWFSATAELKNHADITVSEKSRSGSRLVLEIKDPFMLAVFDKFEFRQPIQYNNQRTGNGPMIPLPAIAANIA
jgi:hypothetical protein